MMNSERSNEHTIRATYIKPDAYGNPLFICKSVDTKSFAFLKAVMMKIDRKFSTYNPINLSSKDQNIMFMKCMKSAMKYDVGSQYDLTITPIIRNVRRGKTVLIRVIASEEVEEEFEVLDVSDFSM